MQFKYIGLKEDGERAFQEKTGIEWMPGAVHEVSDPEVAAEMCRHPTIWEPKGDVALSTAKPKPKTLHGGGLVTDEEVDEAEMRDQKAAKDLEQAKSADPLAGLDDAGVRKFAKDSGLNIKGIGLLKGKKLLAKVREALAAKK